MTIFTNGKVQPFIQNNEYTLISANENSELQIENFILKGDENRTLIFCRNSLLHLENISFMF